MAQWPPFKYAPEYSAYNLMSESCSTKMDAYKSGVIGGKNVPY